MVYGHKSLKLQKRCGSRTKTNTDDNSKTDSTNEACVVAAIGIFLNNATYRIGGIC